MSESIDLLETIRVADGAFCLLPLHRRRMQTACRELYGCDAPKLSLTQADIPREFRRGTVKCRVTYGREIVNVEFERYEVRRINTLKLIRDDAVDYRWKYADRRQLSALHALRGDADEVVIVRNGMVTDTTFSNLICRAGDRLLTPSRPLLEGVMRRWLIDNRIVEAADITAEMLAPDNRAGITEVILVNAMLPLGALPAIPLACVF